MNGMRMAIYARASWPFLLTDRSLAWMDLFVDRSTELSVFRAHWLKDPYSEEAARWLLMAQESFHVSPFGDWGEAKKDAAYLEAKSSSRLGFSFYWWSMDYDLSFLSWSGFQVGRAARRLFAHTSYYGILALEVPMRYRKSTKVRGKYLQRELNRLLGQSERVERALSALTIV